MASTSVGADRLNSWKDIAAYLRCDVRTAIRWEKSKGLPVHRVPGGQRQSVFAYREEIDLWLTGGYPANGIGQLPGMSDGPSADEAVPPAIPPARTRRLALLALCAAAAILLLGAVAARFAGRLLSPGPPQLTGFTQISHDYLEKLGLLTDGTHLYFGEERNGRMALAAMSTSGGPTRILWNPPENVLPEDISPDGRHLLAITSMGVEKDDDLWIVPAVFRGPMSDPPRRLGDATGHSAAWSPDGKQIAYATGKKIYLIAADGTKPRELGAFKGIPAKLRWSPDGRHLRFLLRDPTTLKPSYWELTSSNDMATAVLSGLQLSLVNCCGEWSRASGSDRYFLTPDDQTHNSPIWMLQYSGRRWHIPLRATELHTGLADLSGIAYSRPAHRLFVLSQLPWRSALVKFDPRTREFRYVLPGISGIFVDYSRDGRWVAYVRSEDDTLWVSRADGSNARQLTYPPDTIELPRWSPDGKSIAYTAKREDNPWRIYTMPRDGGEARAASAGDHQQGAPTWSPDGKFLVYGSVECITTHSCAIHKIDLATGRVKTLPGSNGLQTARWSPNGRFIAALRPEQHQLLLFDVRTQRWRKLADGIDGNDVSWSNDSEAVYASCVGDQARIVRIPLAGRSVETVLDLKSTETSNLSGVGDAWFAIAPDDSILFRHGQHASEIFAYKLRQ